MLFHDTNMTSVDQSAIDEIDPADWENIDISFYEPKNIAIDESSSHLFMEKSAGFSSKEVEPLFRGVSSDIRASVLGALKKPGLMKKVSDLRFSLKKETHSMDIKKVKNINMISEILKLVLARVQSTRTGSVSNSEINDIVDNYIGFLETGLKSTSEEIKSYRNASEAIELNILEKMQTEPGFLEDINKMYLEKQRLGALFQAGSSNYEYPVGAQPECESKKTSESKDKENTLQASERFKNVKYDSDIFNYILDSHLHKKCYIQTVFDLLSRDNNQPVLKNNWTSIKNNIFKFAGDEEFREILIQILTDFAADEDLCDGVDLLFPVLTRAQQIDTAVKYFNEIIIPRGGRQVAKSLIDEVIEKDGKRAICLLARMISNPESNFKREFTEMLKSLSMNKMLLTHIALEDTDCFVKREVLGTIMKGIPIAEIKEQFKMCFLGEDEGKAIHLVEILPETIKNTEYILFSAMDYGNKKMRIAAIGQLWRYSSRTVEATIIELIKEMNYQDTLNIEELNAAIQSLAKMQGKDTLGFINEVLNAKSMFRYKYRTEIRKALTGYVSTMPNRNEKKC